jgi:hypothetical protein
MLISAEAAGHSHLELRVELFERLGSPAVSALARRHFIEGRLNADDLEVWVRLALPVYTRTPRDPRLSSARSVALRSIFGSRDLEEKVTRSISPLNSTRSSARRLFSALKMIR